MAEGKGESSEDEKVAWLARLFGDAGGVGGKEGGVVLGIGDDAAVLDARPGRRLVWTVDTQVEGVHFRRDWLSAGEIGWRAFVAAASDLAAMGAEPWCALSALVLPKDF